MAERSTKTTASGQSMGLIVTLVVLILLAAGAGGWFGLRPILAAPADNAGTQAPNPPAGAPAGPVAPLTVPFDPFAGLDANKGCRLLGVWSGIGVVGVALKGDTGQEVLRAIDVKTGEVLWTYDKTPDGRPFSTGPGMVFGDRLAVGLVVPGGREHTGDYVVIMSLAKGDVVASRFFPAPDSAYRLGGASLSAYVDGVVVIDWYEDAKPGDPVQGLAWTTTEGYQDTNLETPIWQAEAVEHPGSESQVVVPSSSDKVLSSHWVLAASWAYVRASTGEPSPQSLFDGMFSHAYFDQQGRVTQLVIPTAGMGPPTLSGMDDPVTPTVNWSYSLPSGQGFEDQGLKGCSSETALFIQTVMPGIDDAWLSAINLADSQLAWSLRSDHALWGCVVVSEGDKQYVAVRYDAGVYFFDAASGSTVGKFDINANSALSAPVSAGLYPCGEGWVCALSFAGDSFPDYRAEVTAIACDSGAVSRQWSMITTIWGDQSWVRPTDTGLVILTQPSVGAYEWLIA